MAVAITHQPNLILICISQALTSLISVRTPSKHSSTPCVSLNAPHQMKIHLFSAKNQASLLLVSNLRTAHTIPLPTVFQTQLSIMGLH